MNPKVKTGLHFIPVHYREEDRANFWGCPATWQKLVYSGVPDKNHLKFYIENTDCMIAVRNHAKSEDKQAVWDNPDATGRRHAQEWAREIDGLDWSRIAVEGINEFPIWIEGGEIAQLRYELAFGEEGIKLGLPTLHAEFAVGWPGNGGIEDAPPNWNPWIPLLNFIQNNKDRYLGLHEYWGFNKGVMFYAGWWFLRYRSLPIKVPTVLTELGGLKAYENPDGSWGLNATDGWMGDIDAWTYFTQWKEAEAELQKDDYLLGATTFTTDAGHPWIEQCDCNPVNNYWVSWSQEQPDLKTVGEIKPSDHNNVYIPQLNTSKLLERASKDKLTLDPLVLEAITMVESNSSGFGLENKLKIRVEAHLLLDENYGDPEAFTGHFQAGPNYSGFIKRTTGEWYDYHKMGQTGEWNAFELARSINPELAMLNTSMGSSQVMGFNHKRIGYETVQQMWNSFNRSEGNHIYGITNYILSDPQLIKAVKNKDWKVIGKLYNGSERAGEKYKAAYNSLI
jgi:hypothetical protein